MATLRDVAEQASVSVSTASRVLNGSKPDHPVSSDVRGRSVQLPNPWGTCRVRPRKRCGSNAARSSESLSTTSSTRTSPR